MFCPKLLDLQSYLDGELSPRHQRAIEKHLKQCSHCRAQVDLWHNSVQLMQRLIPPVEVPRVPSIAKRWAYSGQKRVIAAVAVLIISVGLSAFWMFNGLNYQENSQDPRETELMNEYLILHMEESRTHGGSNV